MRKLLLAAAPILLMLASPTSSQADAVGAGFGAGSGLVVAGPPGAVVGGGVPVVGTWDQLDAVTEEFAVHGIQSIAEPKGKQRRQSRPNNIDRRKPKAKAAS